MKNSSEIHQLSLDDSSQDNNTMDWQLLSIVRHIKRKQTSAHNIYINQRSVAPSHNMHNKFTTTLSHSRAIEKIPKIDFLF